MNYDKTCLVLFLFTLFATLNLSASDRCSLTFSQTASGIEAALHQYKVLVFQLNQLKRTQDFNSSSTSSTTVASLQGEVAKRKTELLKLGVGIAQLKLSAQDLERVSASAAALSQDIQAHQAQVQHQNESLKLSVKGEWIKSWSQTMESDLATALSFSPDGNTLLSGSELGRLSSIHVENGRTNWSEVVDVDALKSIDFAPHSDEFAVGTADNKTWIGDARDGSKKYDLANVYWSVYSTSFSHKGDKVAIGVSDGTLIIKPLASTKKTIAIKEASAVYSVAFSPDDSIVASALFDGTVNIHDGATGETLYPLQGGIKGANQLRFSPDGTYLAVGYDDHTVRVWNLKSKTIHHSFTEHKSEVATLAFSADGNFLATGARDGSVLIFRMDNKTVYQKIEFESRITQLDFSKDNALAIATADGVLALLKREHILK